MPQKLHYITIRGTKDGLVFILDDSCSFDELLFELKDKLSADSHRFPDGSMQAVKLKTGNRYFSEAQKKQICDLILKKKNLIVEEIESNVITKVEADRIAQQSKISSFTQMVRSGQLIEVIGDLLLVGDVNSGAGVKATGNIYIMGALRGEAHAGCEGNKEAVIAASALSPSQLRIADVFKEGAEIVHTGNETECAFIDRTSLELKVEGIQSLHHLKRSLAAL